MLFGLGLGGSLLAGFGMAHQTTQLDSYAYFRGHSNDHALRGYISAARFGTHRRFRSLPHRGPRPKALTKECAKVDVLPFPLVGVLSANFPVPPAGLVRTGSTDPRQSKLSSLLSGLKARPPRTHYGQRFYAAP